MRYDFSTEQQALQQSLRKVLDATCGPRSLRELWETETGRDPDLWSALSDLGIPGVLVPESYAGLGGNEVDMCLVLEQMGWYCVPDAILESCVTAPLAIALAGSPEQRERWLPGMASGELRATVALDGVRYVPDAHVSDLVVVERDGELRVFCRDEFSAEPVPSMDPSRRLSILRLDGAGEVLPLGREQRGAILARELAGSALILNGVAARLLAFTVEYVKMRSQFGRTIGSFQAVKHQLAQAAALQTVATTAARTAAFRMAAASPTYEDSAYLARICAVESERECNRVALQLHGGIGFTWEYDLQLWLKRGKVLELTHGALRSVQAAAGRAGLTVTSTNAV